MTTYSLFPPCFRDNLQLVSSFILQTLRYDALGDILKTVLEWGCSFPQLVIYDDERILIVKTENQIPEIYSKTNTLKKIRVLVTCTFCCLWIHLIVLLLSVVVVGCCCLLVCFGIKLLLCF